MPQDVKDWILYSLALNASGLLPMDMDSLAKTISYNRKRLILGHGLPEHSDIDTSIFHEFDGQYKLLSSFENALSSLDMNESELPFLLTVHSRKGGVGKTLLVLTLALLFAKKGIKNLHIGHGLPWSLFSFYF